MVIQHHKRQKRNISGLKNQPRPIPEPSSTEPFVVELKAFEMNKSNGGKQHHQKDTMSPNNNPTTEHRGKIQKMTTDDGQQQVNRKVCNKLWKNKVSM